jgi:hypothetical protein
MNVKIINKNTRTNSPRSHAVAAASHAVIEMLEGRQLMTATPFTSAYDTDVAVDSNGTMHVAWYDAAAHDLKYATRSAAGVWSAATVVHGDAHGSADVGQYVSIALNAQNRPSLAYADSYNADLYYATLSNGAWTRTRLDTRNSMYTSIAFGTDNLPVISYYQAQTDDLCVARMVSPDAWERMTVDSTDDVGRSTSLALIPGTGNRFAVAYEKSTDFDYRYIEQTGAWGAGAFSAPQTFDADTPGAGGHTSLAFGAGNRPAVAYYDAHNADTKFASRAVNGTWSNSVVWTEKAQFNTLFYEAANNRFMLIGTDFRSDQLVLWTQNGSFWDARALEAGGGKTAGVGVRADGTFGYAYISRYDPVNTLGAQLRPGGLGSPNNPAATALSSSQIRVTWQDRATGENGYVIERSIDSGNFTEVGVAAANATAFTDTSGLQPGTQYFYRVRAMTASGGVRTGYSSYSFVRSATTQQPSTGTPIISENFTSGAGGMTAVDGTWGVNSGAYRLTANNTAATTHLNSRSVHNTVLDGDFTLTVDAQAVAGSAPWTNVAVIFGYQDANNYYFFSSNQSNDGATNGIFRVVNGVSTELADVTTTITPGVTYQLRVEREGNVIRAYRDGVLVASATDGTFTSGQIGLGTRQFQASFDNLVVYGEAAPEPTTPPLAPAGLGATAVSSARIDLAWTDSSTDETGFKIERSSNGGSTWTQIATVGAGVTNYAATGLTASTAYQFRVRAYNAVGDSAYSNTASATTQAAPTPPLAPAGLGATAASSVRIDLAWTDNSSDETGFKVERSTNGGATWTQVATLGAGVTSYAATGLSASTTYQFRVRAYNAGGDSAYSNTASATTQAGPAVGAKPTEANTGLAVAGISEASLEVVNGSYTASAGEILEGKHFKAGVIVPAGANNVVIRNCLISGGNYGIQSSAGALNLLVENTEIRGTSSKGMLVHNATVRRVYIHDVGSDGMFIHDGGNMLIEYSYITRCGKDNPTDHTDGIQVHTGGSNIVIRNNHINLPGSWYNQPGWGSLNSCIVFQSDWGAIRDSSIENNWLYGGGYTVRLEEKGGYEITGITVTGNRFGRDYHYAPRGTLGSPGFTWTNNVYDDNDQVIS